MSYTVLLITSFSNPWDNGWYYQKGFEKNGHTVFPFNAASFSNPVETIRQMVKELKPDFIVHTKNELPAEVFYELMRSIRVIQWHPDPIIQDWLPSFVKAADVFFTMSEGLLEEFRKINANSFWLTQAFEPSFFEIKEIAQRDSKLFSADIAFVGNLGSMTQYLNRRRSLNLVIDSGFDFKWWGPRIPRKISTLPLILGKLGRSYGGQFVWGESYAKVAKLSKIFLAFDSMPHLRKSMSARMYTAVGCGAFYMCRHVQGIEEVLEPDREIITFDSDDEMIDKIRYYLPRETERRRIAGAGQARVLRDHTYEVRVRQLLSMSAPIL
jgi:spore maturation protein CgeB